MSASKAANPLYPGTPGGGAVDAGLNYVAIGASDTVGVGADDPETEGWPAVLHQRLPAGSRLHRLGISGSTAQQALIEQVPGAEAARPDIVTIWLVINDFRSGVSVADYRLHLDQIVERMCRTGALVLVGNMPDLIGMPEFSATPVDELERIMLEWNLAVAQTAARHGAVLVDLLDASKSLDGDKSLLLSTEDRFHPSTLGHLALAEIFFHYLDIAARPNQD